MRRLAPIALAALLAPSAAFAADTLREDLDELRGELSRVENLLKEGGRENAGRAQERLSMVREKFDKFAEKLGKTVKLDEKGGGTTPARPVEPAKTALDESAFNQLKSRLTDAKSASLKETQLKTALASSWVTAQQALSLLRTYKYTDQRLAALRLIAPRLVDRKDVLVLQDAFEHADEKEKALKIVNQ